LRSGKVMVSEPITTKKWTIAPKNAIVNLSRKQIPKNSEAVHSSQLHSARQQPDSFKRTLSLSQN
jgi:hypothetical protein